MAAYGNGADWGWGKGAGPAPRCSYLWEAVGKLLHCLLKGAWGQRALGTRTSSTGDVGMMTTHHWWVLQSHLEQEVRERSGSGAGEGLGEEAVSLYDLARVVGRGKESGAMWSPSFPTCSCGL